MNYKIRKAKIEDAKIINSFLTKLINDEKKYDDNINENCIVCKLYENLIEDTQNCILVAEVDKKIIGYLYGYIKNNGDAYINNVAQLEAMFVEKEYRKIGIGNKLITRFKKWSKEQNVKYIELKVCNNNDSAISLYKKNNFEGIKTIMSLKLED